MSPDYEEYLNELHKHARRAVKLSEDLRFMVPGSGELIHQWATQLGDLLEQTEAMLNGTSQGTADTGGKEHPAADDIGGETTGPHQASPRADKDYRLDSSGRTTRVGARRPFGDLWWWE